MHPIAECMEKDSRLVVGLMSGTSADGVDAALCRITGHGTASKIEQLGFVFQPFSGEIRREILRLASGNSACAADFCKMNFLLGELYVQAVEALRPVSGRSRSTSSAATARPSGTSRCRKHTLDTASAAHSSWEKALCWRSGLAARW